MRAVRKWLTARTTAVGCAVAPRLGSGIIDALGSVVGHGGPLCPVISRIVTDNMRTLGVYSTETYRRHFAELGAHFTGALHVLRCAGRSPGGISDELTRTAAEYIELDSSIASLRETHALGKGAIIMAPHITNYLLGLTRLSRDIPLTIYFRYSKDAGRREAKERWCRAAGMTPIVEIPETGQTPDRIRRITTALDEGRTVFIPPDLPRKLGDGVAVRFFEREINLPAGAAVLAVRTGAPLFTLVARSVGGRQRLMLHGPSVIEPLRRGPDEDRAAVQQHLQWFAEKFERFIIDQAPLWYFWGDKRWTRVFRNDPRYVRDPHEASSPPSADTTADTTAGLTGAA